MVGAAAALASCSGSGSGSSAVALVAVPDQIEVGDTTRLPLRWSAAKRAARYDVELNGVIVAAALSQQTTELAYGDGATGFVEGVNTWRVRAVTDAGAEWSAPSTFEVVPLGAVRARRFDHEDDGAIALTTRAQSGTTLFVSSAAALGSGKGLIMRGTSPQSAAASKDHHQQSIETCWVRLAVRPMQWSTAGAHVNLLRVRSSKTGAQERLVWSTGNGVSLGSLPKSVQALPVGKWTQLQLGALADGTVELWSFDGQREHLVGRGPTRSSRAR